MVSLFKTALFIAIAETAPWTSADLSLYRHGDYAKSILRWPAVNYGRYKIIKCTECPRPWQAITASVK